MNDRTEARVRMYRQQGLGDCFLLSFPKGQDTAHMLIDCGVLTGTKGGSDRMRKIVDNIVQETNGQLDVLVVTHEHWDHVSGFVQAAKPAKRKLPDDKKKRSKDFGDLQIAEVWLAWTENPEDQLAQNLSEFKVKALDSLNAARRRLRLSAAPSAEATLEAIDNLSAFYESPEEDDNAEPDDIPEKNQSGKDNDMPAFPTRPKGRSVKAAMDWARTGTGGHVSYLYPGKQPDGAETLSIPGVEGVRIFVLGPPKNERLKQSRPSARDSEVYPLVGGDYLGFAAAVQEGGDTSWSHPFHKSFARPADEKVDSFFQDHYYHADQAWRSIGDDWLDSAETLALRLDAHTNNTSLVLAIELVDSGRVLLFPGDAQVGNWLSWHDLEWTVKGCDGETETITARQLLARTVLYKVGHHGSHNATLREQGLELMTKSSELVAMIPVDQTTAEDKCWEMPLPSLLAALRDRTQKRVIRADQGVSDDWPKQLPKSYNETELYIDYQILEK